MANEKRGLQGIRTMGSLIDTRRARTPAGALLELSAMANERLLLQKELDRWNRRHEEILVRLEEIAAKERRLMAFVQDPASGPPLGVMVRSRGAEPGSAQSDPHAEVQKRIKFQEFSY